MSPGRTASCCRSATSVHLQSGDGAITKCECGHDFGDYRKNWKLNAAINVRNTEEALREIYPNSDIPDPQWMEIREFICPHCGTLHEVEAARPAIRSCMISSPISKASTATGWDNRSKEADGMGRVAGKVALVTGAGMGLGRAAALLLAAEGARVAVTDIDKEASRQTAELITQGGGESLHHHHDVSTRETWPAVMAAVEQRFGRLDVLVNNAGIAIAKNIEDTTLEEWRRTMAVNLDGVFFGCQQAISLMKKSGGGSIINLSSIDGIIGEAELAAYCASKGGVRTLTKAVAVHCAAAGYGIRCNSIHPGYIWTPQTENYLRDLGTLEAEKAKALARHPIGFLGEPNDIAYMVLYLASDELRFVTGSEMVVDGGYLAV